MGAVLTTSSPPARPSLASHAGFSTFSKAQEKRGLEEIKCTSATARKALVKRVRKDGERDCLEELARLADGTR